MSSQTGIRRTLADYPLSLQLAAQALWGDDFWGGAPPVRAASRPSASSQRPDKMTRRP